MHVRVPYWYRWLGATLLVAGPLGCRAAAPCANLPLARNQPARPAADRLPAASHYQEAYASRSPNPQSQISNPKSEIRPVSSEQILPDAPDELFVRQSELALADYVAEVRRRNPSLQAALAAWQAAAEKYPQAVALDDPMFQSMFAPESFSRSSNVQSSYYLGLTQKLPWRGKRALRGQQADAEADAASFDYLEAELRVALAAQIAFFDYYLVFRELELNRANVAALQELRATAKARYEATQVTQQDVLQADVELAKLERRRIDLAQMERSATARLNALLHRAPDLPLPPPPRQLAVDRKLPSAVNLRELAVVRRPELSALGSRIDAERAQVALASKEFYPDVELMGRFDRFWIDQEQQAQVGMNMNLPVNKSRRRAAVREALFRVDKAQADYEQQVASVRQDVETALARADAGSQTLRLFADKILPVAEDNVSAAVAAYKAGKIDFLRVVEAQRQLIELQESRQAALAQYHRDLAELERATGGPLPFSPSEEEIPVPKVRE